MSSVSTPAQLTLVASNDLYLTKDPKLHLFHKEQKTYTPLASSYHFHRPETQISGLPGESVTFSLRRTGDLLRKLFLRFRGPILKDLYPTDTNETILGPTSRATSGADKRYQALWGPLAYHAIDRVSIRMNSTTVDTVYGDWMYVWSECMTPSANRAEAKTLVTRMSTPDTDPSNCNNEFFFLPIPFWFTEHPSLALPLVALANTEIQITVTFARTVHNVPILDTLDDSGNPVWTTNTLNSNSLSSMELVTEEVTLCEAERKWLASNPISQMITQHDQREETPYTLTKTDTNSAPGYNPDADDDTTRVNDQDTTLSLENFRLPIKQLWVGKGGLLCKPTNTSNPSVSTFITDNRLVSGCYYQESVIMNDSREITERASVRQRSGLPLYQDGKHIGISSSIKKQFLGIAGQTTDVNNTATMRVQPSVFSFSMGLDDLHPQGAVNFSRMKSPRLVLKGAKLEAFPSALSGDYREVEGNYVVLAENYNVLDIRDGTAYLRFTD